VSKDASSSEELTVEGLYRNALWSPAIVAILGIGAGTFFLALPHLPFGQLLGGLVLWIGFVSAASLIPYGLYLLIVKLCWPPISEADYRRVVLMAPIGSGCILFLIVYGMIALDGSRTSGVMSGFDSPFSVTSNLALGVGAVYVGVIELVVWRFKRRRALAAATRPPTP
jgi:hypothetical protein